MVPEKPPRITFRRLQVFLTIAECGGFGAAAAKLGMAQPSVSGHVEALEQEIGGELFLRRRGRRVDLTDLGRTFLAHARQILEEAGELTLELDRVKARSGGRVTLACQRSLSAVLSPHIAEFAWQHRDIEMVTRVGRQEEVVELVQARAAHLGIALGERPVPGLRSEVVGEVELVIVAPPGHELARRSSIAPAELAGRPFVGAPETSLFGEEVSRLLAGAGIRHMTLASRATEFEFLRALVLADVGLYCCLRRRVAADLAAGALVALPLDAEPLMMAVRLLVPSGPLQFAVGLVAEFLRDRVGRECRSGRDALPSGAAAAEA